MRGRRKTPSASAATTATAMVIRTNLILRPCATCQMRRFSSFSRSADHPPGRAGGSALKPRQLALFTA